MSSRRWDNWTLRNNTDGNRKNDRQKLEFKLRRFACGVWPLLALGGKLVAGTICTVTISGTAVRECRAGVIGGNIDESICAGVRVAAGWLRRFVFNVKLVTWALKRAARTNAIPRQRDAWNKQRYYAYPDQHGPCSGWRQGWQDIAHIPVT